MFSPCQLQLSPLGNKRGPDTFEKLRYARRLVIYFQSFSPRAVALCLVSMLHRLLLRSHQFLGGNTVEPPPDLILINPIRQPPLDREPSVLGSLDQRCLHRRDTTFNAGRATSCVR